MKWPAGKKALGHVKSIGSYARVDNFRDKTVDQIRQLKEAGYSDIYVGIESGDPRILKRNKKGYTPEDIREQMQKLDEAGMVWTGNCLTCLENETVIRCRNVSNAVKLAGRLPRDKQKLLDEIDQALEKGVDFDRERIRKL